MSQLPWREIDDHWRQIAEGDVADLAESIIETIRSAFAGVPRGRVTIHEAEVIDDYGSDAERQKARALDTDESWDQVRDDDITECPTALCHLDADGWRYYVPVYMIWSLRHFRASHSIVSDFTIYTFDPDSGYPRLSEHNMERFGLLNQAQSRAVCWFLRYMAANEDHADVRIARLALDEFWGRFCEHSDAM
jgi:hypothetical protein